MTTVPIDHAEVIGVSVPFAKTPYRWAFSIQTGACSILVRVVDRDGRSGWGEIPLLFHPMIPGPALEMMADSLLDRLVVGRPPRPRRFVSEAFAFTGWHFFPHLGAALISGIEMALWDLLSRQRDLRLADLLGGPVREEMECMWFVFQDDLPEMIAETQRGARAGYRCFYVKWASAEDDAIRTVEAVASELPPGAVLRIDPNESWTPSSAVRYCRRLRDLPIEFIEQPLPRFDLSGMQALRARIGIALATDQATRTPDEAAAAFAQEAMDLLSVCPSDAGGIMRSLEIAAAARATGRPVFLHSNIELGIAQAASVVVGCTAENASYAAQTEYGHLAWDVARGLEFDGPHLLLPSGPGLGIDVDEDAVARANESYRAGEGNVALVDSDLPRRFFPAY